MIGELIVELLMGGGNLLYKSIYGPKSPFTRLTGEHLAFLEKNFVYYQKLPPKSKKIFEKRVAYFKSGKKFIAREMGQVTWEMKILISASAIQLTFGFPEVHLTFFRHILVYPESFYCNTNQRYHKGEVNPRVKAIVLSWKDFVEGYLRKDGRNLGLHEMAHALRLENIIKNRRAWVSEGRGVTGMGTTCK